MKTLETTIEGAFVIYPDVHFDSRGYFTETFNQKEFDKIVPGVTFVQDNQSQSSQNVLRGLHYQYGEHAQAKLVRCTEGTVYDVAVDLRPWSKTYMKWYGVVLSELKFNQFYIPRGCAHGFAVLSDSATFQYKCDNDYCSEAERGVNPFDPQFNIDWKISKENAILSEKDKARKNYKKVNNVDLINMPDMFAEKFLLAKFFK